VAEILHFFGRHQQDVGLKADAAAACLMGGDGGGSGCTVIKSCHIEPFTAIKPQSLRVFTILKLQRQHAHADEVGTVDALKTLGNHRLDTKQVGAFGRPVA